MPTFNSTQQNTQTPPQPDTDFQNQVNDLISGPAQSPTPSQSVGNLGKSAIAPPAQPIDQQQQTDQQPKSKDNWFTKGIKFIGQGVINYAGDIANIQGSKNLSKEEGTRSVTLQKEMYATKEKYQQGLISKDQYTATLKRLGGMTELDTAIDLPSTEKALGDSINAGLTVAPAFTGPITGLATAGVADTAAALAEESAIPIKQAIQESLPTIAKNLISKPWLSRLVSSGIYGFSWGSSAAMGESKSLGDTLIDGAIATPFAVGAEFLLPLGGALLKKIGGGASKTISNAADQVADTTFGKKVLAPVGNFLQKVGDKFTQKSSSLPDILNFSSITRRLSDENLYGESGQKILDGFDKATIAARSQMGSAVADMENAGFFKASEEELWRDPDSLMNQMEGRAPANKSNPLYQTADGLRTDILNMAEDRIPNFQGRENYYPHLTPSLDILSNPQNKVRQDIIDNMVLHHNLAGPEEAGQLLDSYIDFVKKGGAKDSGNSVIAYMVKNGQADSAEEARGMLTRYAGDNNSAFNRASGSLEESRVADLPFYDPNPARSLLTYGLNSYKRLNIIDQFGAADEKLNTLIGQIATDKGDQAAQQATKLIETMTGQINKMPGEQKAGAFLRSLQVLRITTAQILHLGQSVNEALVSDFGPWFKGIKAAFSDEGVQNALLSGSTVEQTIRNHLQELGNGGTFTDAYMKMIGFNRVQMMNRTISANVGMLQAEHLLNKVLSDGSDSISRSALGDLIGQDALKETLQNGALSEEARNSAAQTMTNMTQFNYDPGAHPNFWASPSGKVIFQFKNFAYDQAKFVKNTLMDQLTRGDTAGFMKSIFHLAVTVPITSEVLLDVKSLITQQKRPTNLFDRYLQDVAHMGGFGILYDTFQQALSGHLAEGLLGPTIGEGVNIIQHAAQAFSGARNAWTNSLKNLLKDFLYQTGTAGGIINREVPGLKPKPKKGEKSILEQVLSEGNPLSVNKAEAAGLNTGSAASGRPAVLTKDGLIDGDGNNLSTQPQNASSHVIAGVDISSYATDPNHEANINKIYKQMPEFAGPQDIDTYIQARAKGSPIKASYILKASKQYDIDPKLILAIIQQDSSFGTKGKGAKTRNAGNVANNDRGNTFTYPSWEASIMGVARFLAKNKA